MKVVKNKHFNFEDDDFIWRYMDLHKFLSFLFDGKLFFTRLDHFDDPLEGLTERTIGYLGIIHGIPKDEKELNTKFTSEAKQRILDERENLKIQIETDTNKFQKTQFANCWFIGKKESFAMWKIYSDTNSVAIMYSPKELIDIVIPSAESYNHSDFKSLIYGFVDYDNIWPFDFYRKEKVEIKYTAYKKDSSYVHEREFRFVVKTPTNCIGKHDKFELPLGDISKDNFKIYANPYMENWKFNNLKRLLRNYEMEDKLEKSKLKVKE